MKFLCLAYGDEEGWNSLSDEEQREALAQDEIIRAQATEMSALRGPVTSVRNWDKKVDVAKGAYSGLTLPLVGFSVINAENIEEVIQLVAESPCARARGVIDIRPFWITTDNVD